MMIFSFRTSIQNFTFVSKTFRKKYWQSISFLVFALALPSSVLAAPYTGINFFGDSLTDTGNIFTVTGGNVPDSNYFNGRFSNGPVYSDYLASSLGLSLSPSLIGGSNFAFGAANTDSHSLNPQFSVLNQVNAFIGGLGGGMADKESLFVLFTGANNIQDAASLFAKPNQVNAADLVKSAANDVLTMVNQLSAVGAENFLVLNSPDLGVVPRFTELLFPGFTTFVTELSETFNDQLETNLSTVKGIDLTFFDTFSFINSVMASPLDFGLTNISDRCYTGDDVTFTGGGTTCANPDEYFFFDGLHPTSVINQLVAEQALVALNHIPEPTPIALILIGWISIMWFRSNNDHFV